MIRIRSLIGGACVGTLVVFGCSQDGPDGATVTGGNGGGATAGASSAGTQSNAGTVASAGAGAGAGVGGAGSAGSGPSSGSSAGGSAAGGVASGGVAGTDSAGTAPLAGTALGGAGGASGGTGGGGGLTPAEIVPELHGFYWEGTCAGSIAVDGHSCPMSDDLPTCPTGGIDREKTVAVKGVAGQTYTINIEVRGVVGTRCYTGGTRASSAALNENGDNNWWYIGGTYANPTGWWNTYELHVSPATGDPSGDVYYFNGAGVQGGDACEREATYPVKYNASFKAKGGGTLTLKIHDHNCKGQQNCGSNPDGSSPCAPRTVDLSGMAASPRNGFAQPPANMLSKTYYPQWLFIAVNSITSP